MAEEKKKKTTVKEQKGTTTKKATNKNNTNKTNTKKTNNQNKKNTTKGKQNKPINKKNNKQVTKKQQPKKQQPKKVEKPVVEEVEIKKVDVVEETLVEKEVTPVIEEPVVTEEIEKVIEEEVDTEEESILEKTLIFDGRENQNLAEVVEKLEETNVVLEDKIIKRSKVRRIIVNILALLILVTIVGTIIYVVRAEKIEESNSQTLNSNIFDKVSKNYNDVKDIDTEKKTENELTKEDYDNIESITLGEFEKKILEKEDMYVLIASTTCYYSIEYESIVDEVFKEIDKKVYRINITSLTKDETTRFRTYYAFNDTPTIFEVKAGVATREVVGQRSKSELQNWLNK